jgi:hypothetical protein
VSANDALLRFLRNSLIAALCVASPQALAGVVVVAQWALSYGLEGAGRAAAHLRGLRRGDRQGLDRGAGQAVDDAFRPGDGEMGFLLVVYRYR